MCLVVVIFLPADVCGFPGRIPFGKAAWGLAWLEQAFLRGSNQARPERGGGWGLRAEPTRQRATPRAANCAFSPTWTPLTWRELSTALIRKPPWSWLFPRPSPQLRRCSMPVLCGTGPMHIVLYIARLGLSKTAVEVPSLEPRSHVWALPQSAS